MMVNMLLFIAADIINQINFNDDLDIYQSLPVFHAVHLYVIVSNPRGKRKVVVGKEKKRRRRSETRTLFLKKEKKERERENITQMHSM